MATSYWRVKDYARYKKATNVNKLCVYIIQVEAAPNSGPMLAVARNLRQERDREEKLNKQKNEQNNLVSSLKSVILVVVKRCQFSSYLIHMCCL